MNKSWYFIGLIVLTQFLFLSCGGGGAVSEATVIPPETCLADDTSCYLSNITVYQASEDGSVGSLLSDGFINVSGELPDADTSSGAPSISSLASVSGHVITDITFDDPAEDLKSLEINWIDPQGATPGFCFRIKCSGDDCSDSNLKCVQGRFDRITSGVWRTGIGFNALPDGVAGIHEQNITLDVTPISVTNSGGNSKSCSSDAVCEDGTCPFGAARCYNSVCFCCDTIDSQCKRRCTSNAGCVIANTFCATELGICLEESSGAPKNGGDPIGIMTSTVNKGGSLSGISTDEIKVGQTETLELTVKKPIDPLVTVEACANDNLCENGTCVRGTARCYNNICRCCDGVTTADGEGSDAGTIIGTCADECVGDTGCDVQNDSFCAEEIGWCLKPGKFSP